MIVTRQIVKGDFVDDTGLINAYAPKRMEVDVDADGRAWPVLPVDTAYNADEHGKLSPLTAHRYRDGDYLCRQFLPDEGEFERCGIKFVTR